MKHTLLLGGLLTVLAQLSAEAQSRFAKQQEAILKEGLALYESERASWVATDLLITRQTDMATIGGYITYTDGDSIRTVFVAREAAEPLPVSHAFSFPRNSEITPTSGRLLAARPTTERERRLFAMRKQVFEELMQPKKGKEYTFPDKTQPNVVLLDDGPKPRAYVLIGPQEEGVLPIGNDLLMTFSPAGRLEEVERLHNSYVAMRMPEKGKTVEAGMHTHLPAHPYITPTDICSLLLYRNTFPVDAHFVIGQKYVSIFELPKKQVLIMEKKAFDRMMKSRQ
ncbi:hypothetical protein [Solirubrum puertoriconensis]|uniref:Uncharacterized protein n=1 Tax=Solirubrum puertoriconensis TaxID=1751427 RepID=A0A9X0HMX1_SOLP1|nr:hypothetical protein [Solirubrum puertoriconensis]KUG08774.1 hypothetical protein ASU33_11615 [Solirubrum puertoriconensis]